jgi:hypothetical protein
MKKLLVLTTVLLITACGKTNSQAVESNVQSDYVYTSGGSASSVQTVRDKNTGCEYVTTNESHQYSRGGEVYNFANGITPRLDENGKPKCSKVIGDVK